MGIAKSTARYLIRNHKRDSFKPPLLVLGRQHVFVTQQEVNLELTALGAVIHPVPDTIPPITDMPDWEFGRSRGYLSDRALFWTVTGIQASHLDRSDYENAEYIFDLNHPVSEEMKGKFGTIIDGGTIEHVFDVRACMANIASMLRPGGRIIHITQASNWIDHGFYQFSPIFFYDFYGANGFEDMVCHLVDQGSGDVTRNKWRWYRFPREGAPTFMRSTHTGVFFSARSGGLSGDVVVPQQGHYTKKSFFAVPRGPGALRKVVPNTLLSLARNLYWTFTPDEVY